MSCAVVDGKLHEPAPKPTKTFDFIVDPGHGWLKVPKTLLIQLGISEEISNYSYQRGDFAYLEEDRDFGAFITAADVAGFAVVRRNRYADRRSRVRGYQVYNNGKASQVKAGS